MSKCLQFQKPYKCEVLGCTKRYTDPSSLRKHVKSHSVEEQQQYRRSKDLANMAKRSCSPTARYSSWTPSSSSSAAVVAASTPTVATELHNAIHATSTGHPANMDDSQHQQYLQLTSSSTLLQSGGTLLTLDDLTASSSGAAGIPSPMQQHTGQQQKSAENSQSQGSK